MIKYFMLMKIYQALWLSADFEVDFEEEFPTPFKALKYNENSLSDKTIKRMYDFTCNHPIFN